ncbi:DUF6122 family protein [uncultured Eudoraea sp.]|uniref:DUF6122 family protein n=1 Tax=uncultured Eudoraea sp. TaxID=1035614 RepID=UPI00261F0C23|nr:DUF6122 family protein [uncultured Eudoraea sp.]
MLRFLLHYGVHFLVPVLIGLVFFKDNRIWIILILLAGILIDLDHFIATPIFDPDRCSINFHPLHSYWAIGLYGLLFIFKKTRILGLALLIHIFADMLDCYFLLSEAN